MKHVSLAEARANIAELLDEVDQGVDLRISRDGASTVSTPPFDENNRWQAYQALRELREMRKTAPKVSLEEMLAWRHEGHKY